MSENTPSSVVEKSTWRASLLLFVKGLAMGAADVVPGVSGGTIAFITGIYEQLIFSLKSLDVAALRLLLQFRWKAFWEKINGTFLLTLLSGIAIAILSLSKVILYLLQHQAVLLWAFFFGLVLASAWVVSKKIERWHWPVLLALALGAALAYFITVATPAESPEASWFVFLSGAIAICAMILPGISGSFILVLLGKYKYILEAVAAFDIKVVIFFLAGCVVGLFSFVRLLSYMLKRHYQITVALLTGFMLGSLNKVYPWKRIISTDRKGNPLLTENVSPDTFTAITGQDAQLLWAVLLALFAFVLVYFLERLGEKKLA
jgi:putative membrane protein